MPGTHRKGDLPLSSMKSRVRPTAPRMREWRPRGSPVEVCLTPDESQRQTTKSKQREKEMKLSKIATTVCFGALIGAMFATGAQADDWNKKTVITFSGPVEIPGVHLTGWSILPAGTYVFKILDSQSDRHI